MTRRRESVRHCFHRSRCPLSFFPRLKNVDYSKLFSTRISESQHCVPLYNNLSFCKYTRLKSLGIDRLRSTHSVWSSLISKAAKYEDAKHAFYVPVRISGTSYERASVSKHHLSARNAYLRVSALLRSRSSFCGKQKRRALFALSKNSRNVPVPYSCRSLIADDRTRVFHFTSMSQVTLRLLFYRLFIRKNDRRLNARARQETRRRARETRIVLPSGWRLTNLTFRRGPLRGHQRRARSTSHHGTRSN